MTNDTNLASSGNAWYSVLDTVMKIPGVKVDRRAFLANNFSKYCEDDKIIILMEEGTDKAGITLELMDKVAEGVIGFHGTTVVGTSFVAGIPGGLALLGTIPVDVAQYYFHTFQVAQKLAYVYGYSDLDKGSDDDFKAMMTIFIGCMFGVVSANSVIKVVSKTFAQATVKRLMASPVTKGMIYPIVKQIAKVLGYRMTKEIFAKGVGKIMPIVGAFISGGITAAMFLPQANRLKKRLRVEIIT